MLDDSDLDYLFSLTDPKSYKGYYNEFSFPGVLQQAISAEIPRVMEEKPELIEKIQALFENATVEEALLIEKDGE